MPNSKVVVFGTFDIMHPGHVVVLSKASKLGEVHVVLTTDEMVQHFKSKLPVHPFSERKKRLEKMTIVEQVIPSDTVPNSYSTLNQIQPDNVILGYDQTHMRRKILDKMRDLGLRCKISVMPAYRRSVYKSAKLGILSS